MAWDTTDHREVTLARLMASAPDVVYRELEDYSAHVKGEGRFLFSVDDDLEKALAERNDRLIDLGLARYGASRDVVAALYQRAVAGSGDPQHDRGVRLACLSNQAAAMSALMEDGIPGVDGNELLRLALHGDHEELTCLLKNPSVGGLLAQLYADKPPLHGIPDDRRRHLVEASTGNPRLNVDQSNEDGPDLIAWNIHDGIFSLLQTAPVTPDWLRTLRYLMIDLEPSRVASPKEGAAAAVLQRWADLKVQRRNGNKEEDGDFTELTFAEEFRCLVAALYGKTLNKGTSNFDIIGKSSDGDLVLRCAHYGNATMKPDELRQAVEKDGAAAAFAALFNDSVLLTRETRPVLEDQLSGPTLLGLYSRRCERLSQKWKWFDPQPVSETTTAAMQMMDVAAQRPSAESTALTDVKTQLEALKKSHATLLKTVTGGFIIIAGMMLFMR